MKNKKMMLALVLSAAMTITSVSPALAAEWQDAPAQEVAVETQAEEAESVEVPVAEVPQEQVGGETEVSEDPVSEEPVSEESVAETPVEEVTPEATEDLFGSSQEDFTDAAPAAVTQNVPQAGSEDKTGLICRIGGEYADNAEETDPPVAVDFNWENNGSEEVVYRYQWVTAEKKWHNLSADGTQDLGFTVGVIVLAKTSGGAELAWNLNADGTPVSGYLWNAEASKYEYYLGTADAAERTGFLETSAVDAVAGDIYVGAKGEITLHDGLQVIENKTYFLNEDGSLLKNDSKIIDGTKYIFGEDGVLTQSYKYYEPGWVKVGTDYKWRLETGKYFMEKGWEELGGKKYYLNADGTCRTGWITWKSGKYYLSGSSKIGSHGAVVTGLRTISGKTYYLADASYVNNVFSQIGKAQVGFVTVNGKTYYFDKYGVMVAGLQTIDDKKYYFSTSDDTLGEMVTGLKKLSGKYYYFNPDANGAMVKSKWMTVGKSLYCFSPSGAAYTGWKTIKTKLYCFASNGKVKRGLVTISKKLYLFDSKTGVALAGRQTYKDNIYYVLDGALVAVNKWVKEDGKYYYYGSDGILSKAGWLTVGSSKYYVDKTTGARYTGKKKIGSYYYYFTSVGKLVTSKTGYKIGTKYFRINSKGVLKTVSEVEGLAGIRYDKQGKSLSKAFKWSRDLKYYAGAGLPSASKIDELAIYGFKNGKGDCYVAACTFAWMAKVAGYDDINYVRGTVPLASGGAGAHSWCEIIQSGKTYVYDPSLAAYLAKNNITGGYKFSYGDKNTYKYTIKSRAKVG